MDRLTRRLVSWGVPLAMTGVYTVLAIVSGASHTTKAWMAVGLGFVFVVWWMFRLLTEHAALSRAVAVGDAARVLELTERQLRRRTSPAARAPFLVYRALAHELRGEWAAARAALDEAELEALRPSARPPWQLLAASVRIAALVETGQLAAARRVLDHELAPAASTLDRRLHASAYLFARLATGRVQLAEGDAAQARTSLSAVVDDIRAGAAQRATALFYLARLVEPGEPSLAATYRAELARQAPADSWLRTGR